MTDLSQSCLICFFLSPFLSLLSLLVYLIPLFLSPLIFLSLCLSLTVHLFPCPSIPLSLSSTCLSFRPSVHSSVFLKKTLWPFLWMGFNCVKARATSRRLTHPSIHSSRRQTAETYDGRRQTWSLYSDSRQRRKLHIFLSR